MHPLEAEVHHGVEVDVGFHDDAAAIATVTTVRAAFGNVFFAAEAQAAIAAFACHHLDTCLIYEFHWLSIVLIAGFLDSGLLVDSISNNCRVFCHCGDFR